MKINYVNIDNIAKELPEFSSAYVHTSSKRTTLSSITNLSSFLTNSYSVETIVYSFNKEFRGDIMFDNNNFQLGEVNEDITFTIEIYNNSESTKTINEINIINLSGINVEVPDFTIEGYRSVYMTVNIAASGESDNNGFIQIVIDGQIFFIRLNYSRQAIFNYQIDRSENISTTYKYNTEIRTSLSGKEFRDAKMDVPRLVFDYIYKLEDDKRRKFESELINNNLSIMYLPIFFQRVNSTVSGVRISGDFRYTNIKVGNSVYAYQRDINQILEVTAVTETYIEVEKLSNKFTSFYVYPMVRVRLSSNQTGTQVTKNYAKYLLNFDIDEYESENSLDLNTTFNYTMLNNKYFFPDLKRSTGDITKTFVKKIFTLDNSISVRKIFIENSVSRMTINFTMKLFSRDKIAKLKDMFKRSLGAANSFYILKDDSDLLLLESINQNDTIIRVADSNSSVSFENFVFDYVYILYNNKQTAIIKVNEVRKDENNREVLLVDPVSVSINKDNVNFISYVCLARFNNDELTITYKLDDIAEATIELITLNRNE